MGIKGLNQAVDKQNERNQEAVQKDSEDIEMRPPHLETRGQVRKRRQGELTETEETWREGVRSMNRKRDDEVDPTVARSVVWSYKGKDYEGAVEWVKDDMSPDEYISTVSVDMSNYLIPYFRKKESQYRQRILSTSTPASRIFAERRLEVVRYTNSIVDDIEHDFPSADKIYLIYDNPTWRPDGKERLQSVRLGKPSVAKASSLSTAAVLNRRKDPDSSEPPQINMCDEEYVSLPAHIPPTTEEMYPPLPCFLVEQLIAIESRRLADRAHLVVAAGEADFLCRDLLARQLLPGDPRISSYSFPPSLISPPLAPPPPTTAWSSRVDDLQSQNRPLHLILGVDTDHAGLNDHTTCHYIISRTDSLSRATSLRQRHLHPDDWQYSNYASSTMGMVLTSCDHYDGLPFFTLSGVGTRKDHARELPKKEQQEDVLFDICEHALEWRNAYYELFKSPSRLVSVTIGGRRFDFVNSVDLVNHFAKLVKPLFRPTKNIPKFDMNLHDVISIFDGLYGEVDVLVNKSELEKKIEQDLETSTNARLKENYTTPGLRNHCYSSLISPPRIPKRLAAASPPIVRPRRRASSLPRSQHFGEPSSSLHTSSSPQNPSTSRINPSPESPPSPLSKRIPIRRRHSFSAPSTTSPPPPRPRHYQLREGSDGGAHLRGTLSALDKWKKALEQQQKGEGDEGEDANPQPLKKRRFIKSKKGKGKERARGDGDENEGDETKEGKGTSSRAKGVGAGVKDLGLALSAVTYPNRVSSLNNLIVPGIQMGTRFDYSLHLSLNNLLNLWISECPAILELVGLLTSLYTEFSPVLLEQLIGQGGQHFASVASVLVQRTAKFYKKNRLDKDLEMGEPHTTESAPQWLKEKYDAIVGYVPEDRRTKLWDLIDALRFVKKDFESFGKRNEFNLFGLIVVKIRRLLRYSPPIISHAEFVKLNFTTCGTSYSNTLILRGRRLHRTAATALVDHLSEFCCRSPSSPYSASDASLSQLFDSLSPAASSLLEKMSRKRLKRLVSLQIYHSCLPDLTSISNEPLFAPTGDDSEEEEEEEEEEDSDSESEGMDEDVLLSFVKEMDAAKEDSDVDMEEEDPEDSDYEFPKEEEEEEEVNLQQEVRYDEFGSRIFRTIRNSAVRQTSSLLRSTELNDASHELARLFISGTRVASAMIGASIVEGVRHSPDSDVFKGCRTVGDVIMAAGGKEEKLWKDEKFFETREEEETEEVEIEVGEESKFKRSPQLSMVMRISAELWSLTGLPALNFEPDGYHFTAGLLRNFTNPANKNYLPKLLEQLWERNEIESLEFNRLFSLRTPPDRISPFEFPSALPDSAPSASRHAVQFLNSLRHRKDSSFLRLQKSKSKFTLFPVLHDWPRLDYDELPSNGPLPVWRLNDRGRAQLQERSQAVFALFEHLGLTSDEDCEQVEQELWRYIVKPSPGSGKLHRGNVYVTREKVISLVGDLTRYNKTAYSRLPTSTTQPMNCLATAEYLISRQPKVIPVYRKLEARRAAYQQQTGKVELIEVQSVEVVKVRFKEVQKKETTPFPPILRIHAEPNTTTGPPQISLRFVRLASPSTSRPPRVDDRMPLRLSLTTPPSNGRGPSDNERWSEFVTEVIEPRATLPPKEELPAGSDSRRAEPPSPVNAATSSAPRSPLPFVTSQTPIASTSKALLPPSSDVSLSNHSAPTSSRTENLSIPLFAASSMNSKQNRLRLDSTGAGAERVGRDWKEETQRWLANKYWTRPSPFIISSDPGRVYSLVSAQVGTREGKIKFHRTKSSAERVRESRQNAMLAELARWESRLRLCQALQAPGSTSTSTDLSLLLRRSTNPSTPSHQLPAASSSPLAREWFPSQTISIPPPLQGALINSPDYLHAQANRAEQLRRTAERQSNAAKQWREALPQPLDGSSIKVGIVKAKGNISGGRGYGCQNSGEIQEWMIRGVKSLPWVDCLVVECSEGYTSQVCSRAGCYATVVHPTRTGDPSFSELLRLHVCVRCWEVTHRDDDGALNLGAVALGIAKVGKGNFLSPEVAKLMRNKNRLSPRNGKILSTRLWKRYNHLDEPSRARAIMELKASSDLVQLMVWVQSNSADDQAEETLQDEEDDRVDE